MDKKFKYNSILGYNIMFLSFIMIAAPSFTGSMVVLLIITITVGAWKNKLIFKTNFISLFFILFYLTYLVGTLFTNNQDQALRYLEYKLVFILFPILFAFRPRNNFVPIKEAIIGLIAGVFVAEMYGLGNSFSCFMDGGGTSCFVTVSVSPIHHPTYFAVFVLISMVTAWYGYKQKWKGFLRLWIIPFIILGVIYTILTLSLAGILYLMLVSGIMLFYWIYKRFGWKVSGLAIVLVPLLAYLILTKVPYIEGEWNNATWHAREYTKNPPEYVIGRKAGMSGSEQRIVMWTVSVEVLLENPAGVGTGNVDDYLEERLKEYELFELAEKKLNPHNQYLQTGIEIGLFGLLIMMAIIVFAFIIGFKKRNWLLLIITGSLAFNCLFESMLQRQSGVVFFTFWICLFVLMDMNNTREPKE